MTKLFKTFLLAMLNVLLFASCSTIGASEKETKATEMDDVTISKEEKKMIDEADKDKTNKTTLTAKNEVEITEQKMTKNGDVLYRVLGVSYYSGNAYAEGIYIARSLQDAIAISEGDRKYDTLFEKVDFEKEVLVFVFAGQYNTGGYSIEVDSIKRDGKDKILAQFSIISPSMGDIVTQAITSPSMIIAIETKKGEIIKANIK